MACIEFAGATELWYLHEKHAVLIPCMHAYLALADAVCYQLVL